jgi:hypothetical protein
MHMQGTICEKNKLLTMKYYQESSLMIKNNLFIIGHESYKSKSKYDRITECSNGPLFVLRQFILVALAKIQSSGLFSLPHFNVS